MLLGREFYRSDNRCEGWSTSDFFAWPTEVEGITKPILEDIGAAGVQVRLEESPGQCGKRSQYETIIPLLMNARIGSEYYTPDLAGNESWSGIW